MRNTALIGTGFRNGCRQRDKLSHIIIVQVRY